MLFSLEKVVIRVLNNSDHVPMSSSVGDGKISLVLCLSQVQLAMIFTEPQQFAQQQLLYIVANQNS